MVFFTSSSSSSTVTIAVAPLDRAATARPLPQPHFHRHNDLELMLAAIAPAIGGGRDALLKARPHLAPPHAVTTITVTATSDKTIKKAKKSPTGSTSDGSSSSQASPGAKPKKLSTERSRLCRQRQKNHADVLEKVVAALRAEVTGLVALRDLRREQCVHAPRSPSGSLARLVREYCAVFEFGMAPESGGNRKRSLAASRQLTAQEQCDFLLSIMDPDVQVFDWIGRSKRGPEPLVHGWKAWSAWHASIMFHLESVDVLEADSATVAVSTRGKICVKVSRKTIEQLFPHVAHDDAVCRRLLGAEIRYPFRDTFYFNEHGRVAKYAVDLDCMAALHDVMGDIRQVVELLAPASDDVAFDDRAVSTYDGCSIDVARAARSQTAAAPPTTPVRDQRLDLQFLLS